MTTIINTPSNGGDSSGMGFFVGIFAVIVIAVLFFIYALPVIRNQDSQKNGIDVNVTLPTTDRSDQQQQ